MSSWTIDAFIDFHGRRLLVDPQTYQREYDALNAEHQRTRRGVRRYRRGMYGSLLLLLLVGFSLVAHQGAEWFEAGLVVAGVLLVMVLLTSSRRMTLGERSSRLQSKLVHLTPLGSSAPESEQGSVSAEERLEQALHEGPEQWVLLGYAIMAGDGFRPDTQVAMALWSMASDAGCSLGAYRMGCYYKRNFATKNESLGWFYRAAALGSERALGELNEAKAREAIPVMDGRGGRDFVLEHFGLSLGEAELS